jgi:hypothetical protein
MEITTPCYKCGVQFDEDGDRNFVSGKPCCSECYYDAIGESRKPAGWTVTQFAVKANRTYITPEDVSDALKLYPIHKVRDDVLAVIGKQTDCGCEDVSCCAFTAWQGSKK